MPLRGIKRPILTPTEPSSSSIASTNDNQQQLQNLDYSHSLKKMTSFSLPKKGYYDYDRFATYSISSTSELEPKTPPLATQSITSIAASDSSLNDANNSLFIDHPHDQYANLNDISNNTNILATQSSPEFQQSKQQHQHSNHEAPSATNDQLSFIQRKRSYDVQSPNNTLTSSFEPRRHSSARVHHQQTSEAPIRKAINIIQLAQEKISKEAVKKNLEKAIDILKSTELYNPSSLVDNDIHTSDLVSGLMSVNKILDNRMNFFLFSFLFSIVY